MGNLFKYIQVIVVLSLLNFTLSSTITLEDSDISIKLENRFSRLVWRANKSLGSFHSGFFKLQNGILKFKKNINGYTLEAGKIIIDMDSMTCYDILNEEGNNSLINHLKSDDFFSTEFFPTAELELLQIKQINNNLKYNHLVTGNLTILDVTHSIEFVASINMKEDENGTFNAEAEGVMPINRAIYGIKYKSQTWYKDLGDHFIDDVFFIYFNIKINSSEKI